MSDNKKYYYLKLKENFFESESVVLLESMQDGYLYSNILLKLYLKSLKGNGKLMFTERIPYNTQMIATITRHQIGTVEKALKIFEEIGLIEILDTGTIFLLDIQNFIGKSSTEGDRKREYRLMIENEKNKNGTNVRQMSDKRAPEIEIEIELEKEGAKAPPVNSNELPKKERPPKQEKIYPKEAIELTEYLYNRCRAVDTCFRKSKENLKSWTDAFDKLNRLDGRSWEEIKSTLEWAKNDPFWTGVTLSGVKFREKYEQIFIKSKEAKSSYSKPFMSNDVYTGDGNDW